MGKLGVNNFRITRDGLYFLIHRWSPDLSIYLPICWVSLYKEIEHSLELLYPQQKVPRNVNVVFDLQFDHEVFALTQYASSNTYPEYDYVSWTYNGKYVYRSKDWKRIMQYVVVLKELSHED